MVVSKVELAEIPMQMRLAPMVVDAIHASLEDREEVFRCVRVNIAADVLEVLVIDDLMRGELMAETLVRGIRIRNERRAAGDVASQHRTQGVTGDVRYVSRTRL